MFKKITDVMLNIHEKFGVNISNEESLDAELMEKLNAVGGFAGSVFGKNEDT